MSGLEPEQLTSHLGLLGALADLAAASRLRVHLVGGTVRDLLLGRRPPDVDLAVEAPAGEGAALALGRDLAAAVRGRMVPLDPAHDTCRVVVSAGVYLDLAGLRAPDLAGDLAARDFTINALALELGGFLAGSPSLSDPTGGAADLEARLLRPAGPGVLAADPLRVLRGFRFMASHGLTPAPGVLGRLAAGGPGLFRMARERVSHEWLALTAGAEAPRAIRAMDQAMVLTRLLPELARGRGVEQNPYHHLDVMEHSLACLEGLGDILRRPREHMGPRAGEVAAYLADDRRRALAMTAALLHDLGKPPTRQERQPGWATFYRHDTVGGRLAEAACRRLGLSKAAAAQVGHLVGLHMRPFHLLGAQSRDGLSPRAVRRLVEAAGPDLAGVMALAMADTLAGKGPQRPPEAEERLRRLYDAVADLRDQEIAERLAAPPLVDGRQVMEALGLASGPRVGRILGHLREAQLEGEIATPDQALDLARRLARRLTGGGA